jgi:hypothetical protein
MMSAQTAFRRFRMDSPDVYVRGASGAQEKPAKQRFLPRGSV